MYADVSTYVCMYVCMYIYMVCEYVFTSSSRDVELLVCVVLLLHRCMQVSMLIIN